MSFAPLLPYLLCSPPQPWDFPFLSVGSTQETCCIPSLVEGLWVSSDSFLSKQKETINEGRCAKEPHPWRKLHLSDPPPQPFYQPGFLHSWSHPVCLCGISAPGPQVPLEVASTVILSTLHKSVVHTELSRAEIFKTIPCYSLGLISESSQKEFLVSPLPEDLFQGHLIFPYLSISFHILTSISNSCAHLTFSKMESSLKVEGQSRHWTRMSWTFRRLWVGVGQSEGPQASTQDVLLTSSFLDYWY